DDPGVVDVLGSLVDVTGDEAELRRRLSGHAERALYLADLIRARLDDELLATVHLVTGLFESGSDEVQRALTAAGIDEDRLQEIIRAQGRRTIFLGETYVLGQLVVLPPCSNHVRQALTRAVEAADAEGSDEVRSRHLLRGLLAARGAAVVQALAAAGLQ